MKKISLLSLAFALVFSSYGWAQSTSVEAAANSGQRVQNTNPWPGAYQKETATLNAETASGVTNQEISIDIDRNEVPYFGTYGEAKPNGADGFGESLIYTNGPLVENSAGSDLSIVQDDLGLATYGFGVQEPENNSLADDFVLTEDFDLSKIDFYMYQTGATNATINAVYVQIWNGDPSTGGSIVWGDLSTNILDNVEFTNIKRVLNSDQGNTDRIIQKVTANTSGLSLNAGTYWVEAFFGGSGSSGPWMPPITVPGETITGDAIQFLGSSNTWEAALDAGTGDPQGMPFDIYGTLSGSGSCMEINPHYDWYFEIGQTINSGYEVANDITLDADTNFELQSVNLSLASEWPITDLELTYYEDNGGTPGAEIGSDSSPTITSSNAIGSILNSVYNVYSVEVQVNPFQFSGQASSETTYWVGAHDVENGHGSIAFWVSTAGNKVGNDAMQRQNQGSWGTLDPYDGVYTFRGECSPVLGLDDNQATTLQVYPNPASDVINLNAGKPIGTVSLYNILGQEVLRKEIESNTAELNVSQFPAGTYILKNTREGYSETYKIIKE